LFDPQKSSTTTRQRIYEVIAHELEQLALAVFPEVIAKSNGFSALMPLAKLVAKANAKTRHTP
jgi:hypothetical protein